MSKRIRKPFLFVVVAVALATTTTCFISVLHKPLPASPTLAFTGRDPYPRYRAAGFYITNRAARSILLWHVHVEAMVDGAWKTLSEEGPEFSGALETGQPEFKLSFSPVMEPSERRKIVVHWPEDLPWRVAVEYSFKLHGVSAVVDKCKTAWRTRTLKYWQGGGWSQLYRVTSEQVRR
jgi:hypothetical protein